MSHSSCSWEGLHITLFDTLFPCLEQNEHCLRKNCNFMQKKALQKRKELAGIMRLITSHWTSVVIPKTVSFTRDYDSTMQYHHANGCDDKKWINFRLGRLWNKLIELDCYLRAARKHHSVEWEYQNYDMLIQIPINSNRKFSLRMILNFILLFISLFNFNSLLIPIFSLKALFFTL